MLYGRPFIYVKDLFLHTEVHTLQSYTMAVGQFQQEICLWGVNRDPKDSKEPPLYAPGTQVLIKVWKHGSPKAYLQPTWKGSYPHSSKGTRARLLDSPLTSQAVEDNRSGHSKYTLSPWEISDTIQDYK